MLQKPMAVALHHAVMNIPLENHTDHGRMWQQLHHPAFDGIIVTLLQHFRPESRPIQTVNLLDPFLHKRGAFHGTVDCQIAALGMPSDIKGLVQPSGDHIYIFYTVLLPRHR